MSHSNATTFNNETNRSNPTVVASPSQTDIGNMLQQLGKIIGVTYCIDPTYSALIIGATIAIDPGEHKTIAVVSQHIGTGENAGRHKVIMELSGATKYLFLRAIPQVFNAGTCSMFNGTWNCSACTLENHKLLPSCAACGTLKSNANDCVQRFQVLRWGNPLKRQLFYKRISFNAFRTTRKEAQHKRKTRRQTAVNVLIRVFKGRVVARQHHENKCATLVQQFARHVLFHTRLRNIRAANILKRFLCPPLLRPFRLRRLRHQRLRMQRDQILQCLKPPTNALQQHSWAIGSHVTIRNTNPPEEGVLLRYEKLRHGADPKASVQMHHEENIKTIKVADMMVLPAGLEDLSPVLAVPFEDLIDNDKNVLDRCELSIQASMRVVKRRSRMLNMVSAMCCIPWCEHRRDRLTSSLFCGSCHI